MADYHLIMDLLPTLSKLYFQSKIGDTHFSAVQKVIKPPLLKLLLFIKIKNINKILLGIITRIGFAI